MILLRLNILVMKKLKTINDLKIHTYKISNTRDTQKPFTAIYFQN